MGFFDRFFGKKAEVLHEEAKSMQAKTTLAVVAKQQEVAPKIATSPTLAGECQAPPQATKDAMAQRDARTVASLQGHRVADAASLVPEPAGQSLPPARQEWAQEAPAPQRPEAAAQGQRFKLRAVSVGDVPGFEGMFISSSGAIYNHPDMMADNLVSDKSWRDVERHDPHGFADRIAATGGRYEPDSPRKFVGETQLRKEHIERLAAQEKQQVVPYQPPGRSQADREAANQARADKDFAAQAEHAQGLAKADNDKFATLTQSTGLVNAPQRIEWQLQAQIDYHQAGHASALAAANDACYPCTGEDLKGLATEHLAAAKKAEDAYTAWNAAGRPTEPTTAYRFREKAGIDRAENQVLLRADEAHAEAGTKRLGYDDRQEHSNTVRETSSVDLKQVQAEKIISYHKRMEQNHGGELDHG